MQPLERLLNLVAMLLHTRRPLTFDQIQHSLPAYGQGDAASAKRMFERDKDTLRAIGIPIELAFTDAWETHQGYVIRREAYELPEIDLTPEEAAALSVAARAAAGHEDALQGFRKLAAGMGPGLP
jgi:predicted DNA-binding transcriptional regulator YafY